MEGGPTDFDVCVPETGRIFGQGRNVEGVETVGRRTGLAAVELALRGVKFQGCRVRCREIGALVLQDHRDVQGIAGTPDAALTVDETLQPFFDLFPADIESAQTLFFTIRDFEIADGVAATGHYDEGASLDGQGAESVSVGLAGADLAELEVIGFEVDAGSRGGGVDIRGRDPKLVSVGELGDQADVRGHQVDDGEAFGQHVIGRVRRVVALAPIVAVPVIPSFPIIRIRGIPDGGFFRGEGIASQGDQVGGGCVDQGVFRLVGQPDAVDGTGFAPEERTQVDAPVLPGGEILVAVSVQADGLGIDQPA